MNAVARTVARRTAAALAVVALVAGFGVGVAEAGDGGIPIPSSEVVCREDAGYIIVTIEDDDNSYTYDISIDGSLVGDGVSAGVHNYGPYPDGVYDLEITWFPEDVVIYQVFQEVDCMPDTTTTSGDTADTSAAPTTAAAAAPVAAPRYTG